MHQFHVSGLLYFVPFLHHSSESGDSSVQLPSSGSEGNIATVSAEAKNLDIADHSDNSDTDNDGTG